MRRSGNGSGSLSVCTSHADVESVLVMRTSLSRSPPTLQANFHTRLDSNPDPGKPRLENPCKHASVSTVYRQIISVSYFLQ